MFHTHSAGERILQAGPDLPYTRLRTARNENSSARGRSETQGHLFQGTDSSQQVNVALNILDKLISHICHSGVHRQLPAVRL
jgi:hypothetical protein